MGRLDNQQPGTRKERNQEEEGVKQEHPETAYPPLNTAGATRRGGANKEGRTKTWRGSPGAKCNDSLRLSRWTQYMA